MINKITGDTMVSRYYIVSLAPRLFPHVRGEPGNQASHSSPYI